MRWSVSAGVGLLSFLAASGSVFGAEIPVQPKAAPARAPVRPVARPVAQPAPQPAAQATNWSGTQVGGFNGASNMSNSMVEPGAFLLFAPSLGCCHYTFPASDPETPFAIHGHPWSYTAGAFLGYNQQFGTYVVGAETDIAWKNGGSSSALYQPAYATYSAGTALRAESFNGTMKQTWDGSLRARAGFLWTPATLIYATGGLAYGQVSGSFGYSAAIIYPSGFGMTATTGGQSWSDTRVGWTAGGGVETELAPGWKARFEYRFTDLGNYSKSIPLAYTSSCSSCSPSLVSNAAIVNLHPTFQTFRVGLGYNF